MRILLAGTPAMVVPIFDQIFRSDIEVLGVITNPPKAKGRSSALTQTPVALWAKENHLKIFESGRCEDFTAELLDADLVLIIAYGQLIPERFLNMPRFGWINLHFSSLPEARGAAPVQRLIAAGRERIGYSLFQLEKGMDTGPIFFRSEEIPVANMTTGEVWARLVEHAAGIIVRELKRITSGATPTPQSDSPYVGDLLLAPKLTTGESRISWSKSAQQIHQEVLAFNPAPSAWTTFRGVRVLIHRAEISSEAHSRNAVPGEIHVDVKNLTVSSGVGDLIITSIQPAGKRSMSGEEWLRGISLKKGERFE